MDRRVATKYFVFVNLLFCAFALKNDTDRDFHRIIDSDNELHSSRYDIEDEKNTESDFPERKWVSQLFYEAETSFEMDSNVNADCKRDFELYKLHLRNQSIWAVRMMESSEWPSVGIFSGMVDHLGNYDECLTISSHGINGQYCLAQANYDIPNDPSSLNEVAVELPSEQLSAWKALAMYESNPVRVNRRKLNWALCIPSSCRPEDLKISLNNTLNPIFRKHGINLTMDVNPSFCKTNQDYTYSEGFYNVRLIFIIIFLLVISSTCYDIAMCSTQDSDNIKKSKGDNLTMEVFRSFSIVKNFRKLKKVTPNDYAILHFIKIVNILFVVYGHRFIFFIGYPKFNAEGTEKLYKTSSIELIHTNVVDVFFMVSGFLTFHFGLLPMMKGGGFFLFFSVLFRWIRMVPVFGILMLYIIYVLPYTSEGPLWEYKVMNEVNKCKESWWTNLLIINNVVKTNQQCLVVSWYISADIQLSIIGGILLLIYTRSKKWGIFSTLMTFIICGVITFIVAYVNKFHGILRLYMSLLEEPRNNEEFTNFYVATYTRAGPYLIGFVAAVLSKVLKERGFKFSRKQLFLYSVLSILISEGSQFYGSLFYIFGREYNQIENALYAAINRSLFVFVYAWHLCMYFTSGLGFMNKFFEWKIWVPFGRLTYSVFLVNTVIQLYHASSQKQVMPSSIKMNLFWLVFGDIGTSYIIGLVLHLFAEAPISNLSKILQKCLLRKFVKPVSNECVENIDHIEANNAKIIEIESNGIDNCKKFGYHNESYISNETIPKISESSRF